LSLEMNHRFIDLDSQVEYHEGKSVAEIFQSNGEKYFRKIESDLLRKITNSQNFVLATGGGTPCFHDNIGFMNHKGVTVFINTSLETIKERVSLKRHRPLFTGEKSDLKVQELWEQRKNFYEQAHIFLNAMAPDQLARSLQGYKKN